MTDILKGTGCEKQSHGENQWVENDTQECPRCGRPRCTSRAKTRPGERCRQHPIPGGKTCRFHGSATKAAREAAEENLQQQAADQILGKLLHNPGAAPITDPVAELRRWIGQLKHMVELLGQRLGADSCEHCGRGGETLDGPTGRAWQFVAREFRQGLTDMDKNGVMGKLVEIEASRVRHMAASHGGSIEMTARYFPEVAAVLTPAVREFMVEALMALLRGQEPVPPEPRVVAGQVES